jgi:hypothetical protein
LARAAGQASSAKADIDQARRMISSLGHKADGAARELAALD